VSRHAPAWSGSVNTSPVRAGPSCDSIREPARLAHEQRQAIAKVLLGLVHVVGAFGMAASRPFASQLYGVNVDDPWAPASVALAPAVLAMLATLRPARRASRIDPIAFFAASR
jgi:hypothetical protein